MAHPGSRLIVASVLVLLATPLAAQDTERDAVRATVTAFHDALAEGDSTAALVLLADDVVILESGGVEDKAHYRSGHLAGDMRFAQAVSRERGEIAVRVEGDIAWATSSSITSGRLGEREIDAQGAELMVLSRTEEGWIIRAIHWSSRPRRGG